ncbi:hypothetical protein DPMN_016295 [Dreissena polymorpha]|uniref:Uncharacterized protein n=1 Tax=Dreissena polymorpha TaxID=45954 RepID=A0A9D4NFD0_DREPO|nr:hypothetical protein DPMN_016295 [Dreissena polymorpha]
MSVLIDFLNVIDIFNCVHLKRVRNWGEPPSITRISHLAELALRVFRSLKSFRA